MIEDKLLILRFKQGRHEALRQIYDKYKVELLRLAAQKGTDNLWLVAHPGLWTANPFDVTQQPGYEDCMKELKKLNDRLRAQY